MHCVKSEFSATANPLEDHRWRQVIFYGHLSGLEGQRTVFFDGTRASSSLSPHIQLGLHRFSTIRAVEGLCSPDAYELMQRVFVCVP